MKDLKSAERFRGLLLPLLATVVMGLFASCDDDDEFYGYPLQGCYECTYDDGSTDVYQFNSDGTGFYTIYGATWVDFFSDYIVSDDGCLYILWDGAPDWELEGSVEVGPNAFTIWYDLRDPYRYSVFTCVSRADNYPAIYY